MAELSVYFEVFGVCVGGGHVHVGGYVQLSQDNLWCD